MDGLKKLFTGCLTIPNLLSLIRIILIPVFGVLFYRGEMLWAVIILVLSGLTDLFDGKIARKFNQVSELGKVLDPVADKLTQMTIAIILFLTFQKSENPIMIAVGLKPSAAEIYGKVATFAYYFVMGLVITFGPEVGALRNVFTLPDNIMMVLVIISAILTFVALLSYIPGTLKQFKEKKESKSN